MSKLTLSGTTRSTGRVCIVMASALVIASVPGGCGFLKDKGPETVYRDAADGKSLELPPELGAGTVKEPRIKVPKGSNQCEPCVAAAQGKNFMPRASAPVLPRSSKARFVRDGELAWLELEQPPEYAWALLQRYVQTKGLDVVTANPIEGVIDTDWISIDDSSVASGLPVANNQNIADELGRFRFGFRLERTPRDTSRVFVRHDALLKRADTDELEISDSELSNRLLMDLLAHAEGRPVTQRTNN